MEDLVMNKLVARMTLFLVMATVSFGLVPKGGGRTTQSPGSGTAQEASEEGWPREIKSGETIFKVHQPQLESWDGIRVEAYCAIEVTTAGSDNTTYGAALVTARADVDKVARMVSFEDLKVPKAIFPSAPDQEGLYLRILQNSIMPKARLLSLDRFETALAVMEAQQDIEALPLKNDPPQILFSTVPAILVYVDGDPAYRPVKDSKLERVVNTRPLILKDAGGRHYLHLFDGWMEAAAIAGPWSVSQRPHPEVEKAKKEAIASGQVDLLEGQEDPENDVVKPSLSKGPVPVVYLSTTPTELIVTEGEAKYTPIEGTSLLYAENTTGHLFRHSSENKTYVLISGRWFRSGSIAGPWEYVPGGKLPSDFSAIPDDSPKENVKASVPDTPQSMEAVIAASIPQTATVSRKEAKLNPPQFDGEPQFKPIEGTELAYAVNTSTPIVQLDSQNYYAVENAVWFKASTVRGPWVVADMVPAPIYAIPPASPLHFVTYVKIYSATADSVVVGYTSGYYGTCITRGSGFVMVYGTGYRYTPWVGSVWFGPPVTYGFGTCVTYNPWSGWSFSFGFGWHWGVPMAPVYWGWGPHPWWGPVGWGFYYPYPYYRPVYGGAAWGPRGAVAWGPGGWAGTTGNVYHRWGSNTAVTRRSGSYNAWTGNRWASQVGMAYNSRTGNLAAGQRAAVGNVYSGNYAYGGRGSITNTETGRTVSGGRITAGNARTGESGSAGWMRGENAGAVRVGDDIYAHRDGTVYRRGESGWESNSGSGWSSVQRPPAGQPSIQPQPSDAARPSTMDRQRPGAAPSQMPGSDRIQSLERERAARSAGQARTQSFRSGAYRSAAPAARPRRR